jgi:hypothetical protein
MIFDNHRTLPNMLSAILQKNNGTATLRIDPQSIGIPRRPF